MKKKENMECNQQPSLLRSLVKYVTEEQNKQQYESFVTSCIYNGNWDMVVSYKEWLEIIRSYTPQEIEDDEWDKQIRQDFETGKFDQLIKEAQQEIPIEL